MLNAERVRAYFELPQPVLTAYLNTNPAKPANRKPEPEFLTWLKGEAKTASRTLPIDQQKLFQQQLERVETYLRDRVARGRGLVIFAGPKTWETLAVEEEISNETRWGAPYMAPLLQLMGEHKPHEVVILDRKGARFLRYRMGEVAELGTRKFDVNVSDWRKKDMGKVASAPTRSKQGAGTMKKTRGSQRDTFEHRMDARYARLCAETAREATQLAAKEKLRTVFVAGAGQLLADVTSGFSRESARHVVKIEKDLGGIPARELAGHVGSAIAHWERGHEAEMVESLLGNGRGTVVGMDETLAQLQKGGIRRLVLAGDMDAKLRRCRRCGLANRAADAVCQRCGGERAITTVREVALELAWKAKAEIEIVSGEAGERLKGAEGIGGWLRRPAEVKIAG